MFIWQEYWQWRFRYIAMTIGALCCIVIMYRYPQPLCEKSTMAVAAVFLTGLSLTLLGCLLEVVFCVRTKDKLIIGDFPLKKYFDLTAESLYCRGYSMICCVFALIILSFPIFIAETHTLFGFILGATFSLLGLSKIIRAAVREYYARAIP